MYYTTLIQQKVKEMEGKKVGVIELLDKFFEDQSYLNQNESPEFNDYSIYRDFIQVLNGTKVGGIYEFVETYAILILFYKKYKLTRKDIESCFEDLTIPTFPYLKEYGKRRARGRMFNLIIAKAEIPDLVPFPQEPKVSPRVLEYKARKQEILDSLSNRGKGNRSLRKRCENLTIDEIARLSWEIDSTQLNTLWWILTDMVDEESVYLKFRSKGEVFYQFGKIVTGVHISPAIRGVGHLHCRKVEI